MHFSYRKIHLDGFNSQVHYLTKWSYLAMEIFSYLFAKCPVFVVELNFDVSADRQRLKKIKRNIWRTLSRILQM